MSPLFIGLILSLIAGVACVGYALGFIRGVELTVEGAVRGELEFEGQRQVLVPAERQETIEADAASWREHRGW